VYIVNSVNDVIYEKATEGYDTVITNSNYLLNANIEELRLLDGFNIHGTGNALNNTIIGNSADNILDGVTGADTMIGGAGNDTYYVDNTGDVVSELAAEGTDTVQASISYTLGSQVENLVLLDFSKPGLHAGRCCGGLHGHLRPYVDCQLAHADRAAHHREPGGQPGDQQQLDCQQPQLAGLPVGWRQCE
jgi:Ca2+-binding RTX toxin-like protein